MKQYFKYIALDKSLNEICDISSYVEEGGVIDYNALTRLKASCRIPLSLATDEVISLDAVRIYEVLNNTETCLGTFLISTPSSTFENAVQHIECIGYSTLWRISNNSPDTRYYCGQGTNCIAEVKRILEHLGYAFYILDCEKTTSTNREWDIGENYLNIINDLLDTAGYTSLHVDVMGKFVAKTYILPQDRQVDMEIDENSINSIVEPVQVSEIDLFNIPNKFIRYCSNDPNVSLYAVYEQKEGVTGTVNTWVNTDAQEVLDIADYETLYNLCKRDCAEANSVYNKVQIATAINMPPDTYMPTVMLKHYQHNDKFSCTSFTIKLELGGEQQMNLRKVVILS